MSGRWLPALILELFIIGYALAKNGGNCNVDITNVPNFWITFTITTNDNIINAEVFNVTYKDELAFTDITYQSGTDLTKYFTASTNNGYLFLSTTPEMANFDQNTPKQTGDISGSFKVNLKCKDGASDFTVTAIVSDYNNHDPQFDQQEYVYNVASPLMPQIDFSVYGSVIKVTDLDFTNQDVTFTLDNEDFTITTIVDAADNKSYIPVFSAKSVIFLSDTRTYTLTAKDSGTNPGPRTSTATIKLVYDESVSLDAPSFGQPAYNFNYTIENDAAVLTPLDGPITLNTAKGDEVVLSIVGDLKDSLNVTITKDSNEITIKVKKPFDDKSLLMVATLEAKTDNAAIASLIFHMPKRSLEFGSHLYTGIYDVTDSTVTLNTAITINAEGLTATPTITVSGGDDVDFNTYFSFTNKSGDYGIIVNEPIPDDILQQKNNLVYTLTATLEDLTSESVLIINFPKNTNESIHFSEVLYIGSYKFTNGKVDLTTDKIEVVNPDATDIVVSLTGDSSYINKFHATYSNNEVKVTVDSDFTSPAVDTIVLVLNIEVDGTKINSAVLNIAVEGSTDNIKFEKNLYNGKYTVESKEFLFEDTININTNKADDEITASILEANGEVSKNFNGSYAKNVFKIELTQPLDDTIVKNSNFLTIIPTVTVTGTSLSASTIVNIDIVKTEPGTGSIEFSNSLYNGNYTVTGDSTGEIVYDEISITTDQTDVNVSITNDYSQYFTSNYKNDKVSIETKGISSDVLVDITFIPLQLEAHSTTNPNIKATAVLNLNIIGSTDYIGFEKNLYNGKYTVESKEFLFEDTININTNKADDEITASILEENGEVSKNFKGSYAKNVFKIELTQPLDDTIVKNSNFLTIIPTVTVTGTSLSASTIVNIDIVKDQPDSGSIVFSSSLYNGNYTVTGDGTGEIEYDDITITTDQAEIKLGVTNEFTDYFTISDINNTVTIETKGVPSNVLAGLTFIPLLLEAQSTTNPNIKASAVLNFNIIGSTDYIEFEKNLYNGKYTVESKEFLFEDTININTNKADDEITASILEENGAVSKNFKGSYAKNVFKIELTQPLDDTIVKNSNFLTIIPTVTVTGTSLSASTIVNIDIVKTEPGTGSIEFSNSLYNGNYTVTGDSTGEIVYDEISITTDQTDVNVSITNDYSQYFTSNYKNDKVSIETKGISSDVLVDITFIPLQLEAHSTTNPNIKATAVLNLNIIGSTDYIEFEKNLYNGKYTVESQEFLFEDTININTNKADDEITASILEENGAVSKNFKGSYAKNVFKIELTAPLDDTIVKNSNFLTIIPTVTVTGTSLSASTIVNIDIVKNEPETGHIEFSSTLYNGNYKVIDQGTGTVECENISLTTDQTDIEVTITNGYAEYFKVTYADNIVTLTTTVVPPNILANKTYIPLLLEAHSKANQNIKSSTVVTLNIIDNQQVDYSIAFEKPQYTGHYVIDLLGPGEFTIDGDINILTNYYDAHMYSSITDDNGNNFAKYFFSKMSNNKYTVGITNKYLSEDIYNNNDVISLILQAGIASENLVARTILNIQISRNYGSLKFSELLYEGSYTVSDDNTAVVSHGDIPLITPYTYDNMQIGIAADTQFFDYFNASVSGKNLVTIQSTKFIESYADFGSIPVNIQAEIPVHGTVLSANSILNLKVIDSSKNKSVLQFNEILYNAEYIVKDRKLNVDDKITIMSDADEKDIKSYFTAAENFKTFLTNFEAKYSNHAVTVNKLKDIDEKLLINIPYISLTLVLEVESTKTTANAVFNIKIAESAMKFNETLYKAEYVVKDSKFYIGKLALNSEIVYDNIDTAITSSSGFDKYFNCSYSKNEILIGLSEPIPASELKNVSYIPLTLKATVPDIGKEDSTIVTIKVIEPSDVNPDDGSGSNSDNTGYIIAVVILSLLIIALIAAGIAYYYFKLRNRDYTDVDPDFWKVRFAKNAEKKKKKEKYGDSNIENRRPTGFVFNPLEEEHEEETSTDPTERRKSVLFDENVEKINIEPTIDEDVVEKQNGTTQST